MNWFLNLKTRSKLLIGFGVIVLVLGATLFVGYRGIVAIQTSQQVLYEVRFANALDLMNLRAQENGVRAALLSMMAVSQQSERESWHAEIKRRSQTIDTLTRGLRERYRDDPEPARQFDELERIRTEFTHTRDAQIIPMIYAGDADQVKALALGVQEERATRIRAIAEDLGDLAVKRAQEAVAESEAQARNTVGLFAFAGLLATLVAAVLALYLGRLIAAPLREVSAIAGRIAAGDLAVAVPADKRADEVGDLTRAFRTMVEGLRATTRELSEGVAVLSSSSSEILATTTQVASGAAETATAVSQTTATVEEVKQTAQVANQKAKYVSDSAQRVAQVSQTGRRSVDDAIAGMHAISEQMAGIADSIVRLSEQSQAIAEIIATVNDLAEQSNLLAVNAAIEATRAGEQGKSFAVVAQEVKSLAEQSKQATTQVRAILGEIQKATSAAVLATEQGNKAVEAGVRQSAEAGESIRLLAESVGEAAQAATQIAASSQQQMVGMDQVALAMENIKQASAQNLAGTRQAETAAKGLHELGLRLKRLAEQYRT